MKIEAILNSIFLDTEIGVSIIHISLIEKSEKIALFSFVLQELLMLQDTFFN